MHVPRPSRHWLWRGLVLAVLVVAGCTPNETPESIPTGAKKPEAPPPAQSARVVKGWDVRPLPTVGDVKVTDAGAGQSNPAQSTPTNQGLDFEIEADPDIGRAPLTVHFAAVTAKELAAPLSYRWDFGDGGIGEGSLAIHTYTTPGEYTVALSLADGTGRSATRDVQIQVDPGEPEGDGADE